MTETELWNLMRDSKATRVFPSKFGDVGITDDLKATCGYHYRTTCVHGELQGPEGPIKLEPEAFRAKADKIADPAAGKSLYKLEVKENND